MSLNDTNSDDDLVIGARKDDEEKLISFGNIDISS